MWQEHQFAIKEHKKTFEFQKAGIDDPQKIETLLNAEEFMEVEILDGIKDDDLKPNLNREEGIEQVKKLLGMRINKNQAPSIIWHPFWEFRLIDRDTNHERSAWIDGVFGSYLTQDPKKG